MSQVLVLCTLSSYGRFQAQRTASMVLAWDAWMPQDWNSICLLASSPSNEMSCLIIFPDLHFHTIDSNVSSGESDQSKCDEACVSDLKFLANVESQKPCPPQMAPSAGQQSRVPSSLSAVQRLICCVASGSVFVECCISPFRTNREVARWVWAHLSHLCLPPHGSARIRLPSLQTQWRGSKLMLIVSCLWLRKNKVLQGAVCFWKKPCEVSCPSSVTGGEVAGGPSWLECPCWRDWMLEADLPQFAGFGATFCFS